MDANELRSRLLKTKVALLVSAPVVVLCIVSALVYSVAFTQSIALTRAFDTTHVTHAQIANWSWLASTVCINSTDRIATQLCRKPAWAWMDLHVCGNFTEQIIHIHCSSVQDSIFEHTVPVSISPGQLAYAHMQANSTLFAMLPARPSSETWIGIQTQLLRLYDSIVGPWILFAFLCSLVVILALAPVWLYKQLQWLGEQKQMNMAMYSGTLKSVLQSNSSSTELYYQHSSSASSSVAVSAVADNPFATSNNGPDSALRKRFNINTSNDNITKQF